MQVLMGLVMPADGYDDLLVFYNGTATTFGLLEVMQHLASR